eukprot:6182860-Pleurochrysis_carterae.AAC.5
MLTSLALARPRPPPGLTAERNAHARPRGACGGCVRARRAQARADSAGGGVPATPERGNRGGARG